MMKTGGADASAVRAVLLLTLTLALLFGSGRLAGTVTSTHGEFPLAAARFVAGTAGALPGRTCMLAADGLPVGLGENLGFRPGVADAGRPTIWLLGSGLRHHYALVALMDEKMVISFDAHADMRSGDAVDCGNWLRHWLAGSPDRRGMVIGVSEKLGGEGWVGSTEFMPLTLLADGRAQLWPVRARRSFFRKPLPVPVNSPAIAGAGGDERGGWLAWRSLDEWELPRGGRLALSIDLDCLAERGFAAEWDPGELSESRLLVLLRQLAEGNTITSVSICGFAERQTGGELAALLTTLRGIIAATEQKP